MSALSGNLPRLYFDSIILTEHNRCMDIFSQSHSRTVGVHTKQAGDVSSVDWIKWKASGIIRVWAVGDPSVPFGLVHLADAPCLAARRVNGEAVGWRETGFPRPSHWLEVGPFRTAAQCTGPPPVSAHTHRQLSTQSHQKYPFSRQNLRASRIIKYCA